MGSLPTAEQDVDIERARTCVADAIAARLRGSGAERALEKSKRARRGQTNRSARGEEGATGASGGLPDDTSPSGSVGGGTDASGLAEGEQASDNGVDDEAEPDDRGGSRKQILLAVYSDFLLAVY